MTAIRDQAQKIIEDIGAVGIRRNDLARRIGTSPAYLHRTIQFRLGPAVGMVEYNIKYDSYSIRREDASENVPPVESKEMRTRRDAYADKELTKLQEAVAISDINVPHALVRAFMLGIRYCDDLPNEDLKSRVEALEVHIHKSPYGRTGPPRVPEKELEDE